MPRRPARSSDSDSQTLPFTSPLMPRRRNGCFMTQVSPVPTYGYSDSSHSGLSEIVAHSEPGKSGSFLTGKIL